MSVANLERPDGSLVQVQGATPARVTTAGGDVDFSDPVQSDVVGDALVVRGGNRGATRFLLKDVESVSIRQMDGGKTVLALVGISLLATAAITIPLRVLMSSSR